MNCSELEACATDDCSGLAEVIALLPSGGIWELKENGVYSSYIRAIGHVKTEINKAICQVWQENLPCKSIRLLDYWAKFYGFPPCVLLTGEKLCEWLDIILDPYCPPGSVGFLQAAIDFVLPPIAGVSQVTIQFTSADYFSNAGQNRPCAIDNSILMIADASLFRYDEFPGRSILEQLYPQDGVNGCLDYFIPEIECLRHGVFPFGLSIGYMTDDGGPDAVDIYGVGVGAYMQKPSDFYSCEGFCPPDS